MLDFCSFVDYGDGLSLPAEVGIVRSAIGQLSERSVYSGMPDIPYTDQR